MHPTMWQNAATQNNVRILRERGVQFIGPSSGALADQSEGEGRMSEPQEIVAAVEKALASRSLKR